MQYSPKLKKAMEQIKSILKENDIAGFVVLHTPGYSEFLNHMETSYSCAKVVGDQVRLRLKASEVGIEKAKEIATNTLNMVTHFAKHTGEHAVFFIDTEQVLKEKYGGDDLPGSMTSHAQQNN